MKYVNIPLSEVRNNASLALSESTISDVSSSAGFEEESLPELFTHHLVDARNTSGAEIGEDNHPLCPLPLDPKRPLVEVALIDELHLIPRFLCKF